MPVTSFQAKIAKIISVNRSSDSYLAGGAALHFEPNSIRFSQDLDYFNDSEVRVAEAYNADHQLLTDSGIELSVEMHQPGYIRVIARQGKEATKIEWAHDSAYRFMPTYFVEDRGFCLHPIDLAINKVLALAGRDESRDYLDVLHAHNNILELPGLIWAACGKDPGFSPNSLLELLQRKGKYQPNDFKRLKLNVEIDLQKLKQDWLSALERSRNVVTYLPTSEVGCLYYDIASKGFVVPLESRSQHILVHYATDGGILPHIEIEDQSL
jgi:predicted nucleotidyltransferase component of viral defense system